MPLVLVTTISLTPAVPVGVKQEISSGETTTTEVHKLVPTLTVAPLAKSVPVMVMAVPPVVAPPLGDTAVTVGGKSGVTGSLATDVASGPTGLLAVTVKVYEVPLVSPVH